VGIRPSRVLDTRDIWLARTGFNMIWTHVPYSWPIADRDQHERPHESASCGCRPGDTSAVTADIRTASTDQVIRFDGRETLERQPMISDEAVENLPDLTTPMAHPETRRMTGTCGTVTPGATPTLDVASEESTQVQYS
jgi:hypothetical protein